MKQFIASGGLPRKRKRRRTMRCPDPAGNLEREKPETIKEETEAPLNVRLPGQKVTENFPIRCATSRAVREKKAHWQLKWEISFFFFALLPSTLHPGF